MKITYTLDEQDYLAHQLFFASQSASIKKRRRRNRIMISVGHIALGALFFKENIVSFGVIFTIIGIIWIFIYPLTERRHFVMHYREYVRENFNYNFGKPLTLEWNNEFLYASNDRIESKISLLEVKIISEISAAIFIVLHNGQSFILPKHKINHIEAVKLDLQEWSSSHKIPYTYHERWEWK